METTQPSRPWEADGRFKMVDVTSKSVTVRAAEASGVAILSRKAFEVVRDRTNPKGDVLALAEAAGLAAAKRTSELIPLCHPLPLNQVRVRFELDEAVCGVRVRCEAVAEAKTGVEMEALCGVNGALLTIYDLSKAVDPVITLGEIRLERKVGGKSGLWTHPEARGPKQAQPAHEAARELGPGDDVGPFDGIRAAVVTVSDRAHEGRREDLSGPALVEGLQAGGAALLLASARIVPDDRAAIEKAALELCDAGAELVVFTGGTGLSARDVTPETLEALCDRWIPGIGERLRAEGAKTTSMSWLSRSGGGLRGRTLLIALPGSPKAVREGLKALEPLLGHAVAIAGGGGGHG